MFTRTILLAPAFLALVACGHGTGASQPAPVASAEGAVRQFLAAASDSNIAKMSEVWGTSSGPASVTGQPAQWEQRLKVVQIYLRGGTWTLIDNKPNETSRDRRNLLMRFTRGDCVKQVPFVALHTSRGWLVESVDVSTTGNPISPCPTTGSGAPATTTNP